MNYHFESSNNKKKPPTGADKMAQWVEAAVGTQKFASQNAQNSKRCVLWCSQEHTCINKRYKHANNFKNANYIGVYFLPTYY